MKQQERWQRTALDNTENPLEIRTLLARCGNLFEDHSKTSGFTNAFPRHSYSIGVREESIHCGLASTALTYLKADLLRANVLGPQAREIGWSQVRIGNRDTVAAFCSLGLRHGILSHLVHSMLFFDVHQGIDS